MKGDAGSVAKETAFQKIYACLFLVLLLGSLGGGFFVWAAKSAIAHEDRVLRQEARGEVWVGDHRTGLFELFHWLGIRDWRIQFGIGASIGVAAALAFSARRNATEAYRRR
jgi:hypothetical protein